MSGFDHILQSQQEKGLLRQLKPEFKGIDFASNDYLGFSRNPDIHAAFLAELEKNNAKSGATGSRLLTGNSNALIALEEKIAEFHHSEAALIYSSGYQANVGLLQCLGQKGETYLMDELIHASAIDGARLSFANRVKFKHNDAEDLERKLQQASGKVYIIVESVYSMDGTICPLKKFQELANQYGASLVVDEAHSVGIYGPEGKGLCVELGIENDVLFRIMTYGKALGTHGAAILSSNSGKKFLINFSRSQIFSTAVPPHQSTSINVAYDHLPQADNQREKLFELIDDFRKRVNEIDGVELLDSPSAIQGIMIPGNENARKLAQKLQAGGIMVYPILSPTVKSGTERIRICLHSYNTVDDINRLIEILK